MRQPLSPTSSLRLVLAVLGTYCVGVSAESSTRPRKSLTLDTMFEGLKEMEYAVRGKVVIAADEIHAALKKKQTADSESEQYPFDHIVYTNMCVQCQQMKN